MDENLINSENLDNFEDILPPPRRFDITRKDKVFSIIFCVVSILMSSIGIWGGFRAGFGISSIIMLVSITIYLLKTKTKIKVFPLFCGLLSVAIYTAFINTSNSSVRFFGCITAWFLSLVWFDSLIYSGKYKSDIALIKRIFMIIFEHIIPNITISVASLFTGDGNGKKTFGKALLGVLFALPVLFVVVPLLMSSDVAFAGLAGKLVSNLALTVIKLVVGFIIALFFISYCFSIKKCEYVEKEKKNFAGMDNAIVVAFLSVISICYLTYLFSQLAYFFSAFSGFLPKDYTFTYAEYARKGFFEMSVIAVINFVVIFIVLSVSSKKDGKICVASRILCNFIAVFTLLIIGTSISKMVLYIMTYGMTVLRITTSSFMLFLAVVFVALIIKLYASKIYIIKTACITAGIILAILGNANVNHLVVEYNYTAYKNNILNKIDVNAIYELGDEGVPYLVKLLNVENEEVSNNAYNSLLMLIKNDKYFETETEHFEWYNEIKILGRRHNSPGQYSIARSRAYKALERFVKTNPEVLLEQTESYYYPDRVYHY